MVSATQVARLHIDIRCGCPSIYLAYDILYECMCFLASKKRRFKTRDPCINYFNKLWWPFNTAAYERLHLRSNCYFYVSQISIVMLADQYISLQGSEVNENGTHSTTQKYRQLLIGLIADMDMP